MRRKVTAGLLLLTLAACSAPSSPPDTHTLRGSVSLSASGATLGDYLRSIEGAGNSDGVCRGAGGYEDLGEGTQVVVRNESGEVIATGALGAGSLPLSEDNSPTTTSYDWSPCTFPIEVTDVPDAEFYTVEVSHRGGLTYSAAELEGLDWQPQLTIGD